MEKLKKRSTTIHEDVRRTLGISRDAYAFCAYVHYRCADSRQKRAGWCCDNKQELADFVGITRPGVYKMGERLVEIGLLEISNSGDYRATPKWIDSEANCKQSLQKQQDENVNKVDKKCKQSLQKKSGNVNKVDTDTYILELDIKNEEREEKNALSPAENPTLEAETLEGNNLPGGAIIEIHDPEFPGVTIHDEIKPAPVTDPPAHRIELGARPTAETPVELQAALREFYADWPNEWSVGILDYGRGGRYDAPKQAEIVKDFCAWAVANNQQRNTYRELNARLQGWFRNEQHSTWKQPKPGQSGNGEKPVYERPKNAIY